MIECEEREREKEGGGINRTSIKRGRAVMIKSTVDIIHAYIEEIYTIHVTNNNNIMVVVTIKGCRLQYTIVHLYCRDCTGKP